MDVSQYLDIFLDESKEHLQNLNTSVLNLEQDPENPDTIGEIFRAAHTLKGMAGTMGFKRMQNLTHDMENVFSEVRDGNLKVNAGILDLINKMRKRRCRRSACGRGEACGRSRDRSACGRSCSCRSKLECGGSE